MWRVLVMGTGGTSNASARARIFCYLALLESRGIRCHVTSYVFHKRLPREPGVCGKLWLELLPMRNMIAFLHADAIYLHRLNFSPWIVRMARMMGKRVVHDFDDAVYLHPPDSAGYQRAESHGGRKIGLNWILKRSNTVIVSGEELRRYAQGHARDVRVIPSVVSDVAASPSVPRNPPVIGWVGAPENQRYLKLIEPALLRLQDEWPDLEVWLITRELIEPPPRFRHRFIRWSLKAEAEWVPQFTVGVAPLDDDLWCRAKMNFKALVYLSHGVPAIVTPGGFPLGDFEEGKSIFAARTPEEWYMHLRTVIGDPERRKQLASGALEVMRKKFIPEVRVAEMIAALTGQER